MTDTELLNWVEHYGVQLWRTANNQWVASVRHPNCFIQPTRSTLREAVIAAHDQWKRHEQNAH